MRSRRGGPLSGKLTAERRRKGPAHARKHRTRGGHPQADARARHVRREQTRRSSGVRRFLPPPPGARGEPWGRAVGERPPASPSAACAPRGSAGPLHRRRPRRTRPHRPGSRRNVGPSGQNRTTPRAPARARARFAGCRKTPSRPRSRPGFLAACEAPGAASDGQTGRGGRRSRGCGQRRYQTPRFCACFQVWIPCRVRHRGGRHRPGRCVEGGVVQR